MLKRATSPILNSDLGFWNSDPKIHFWANLRRKRQGCPFRPKIGTYGILEELILYPDLDFWNSDPKIYFWAEKVKVSILPENWLTACLQDADSYSDISFVNFQP